LSSKKEGGPRLSCVGKGFSGGEVDGYLRRQRDGKGKKIRRMIIVLPTGGKKERSIKRGGRASPSYIAAARGKKKISAYHSPDKNSGKRRKEPSVLLARGNVTPTLLRSGVGGRSQEREIVLRHLRHKPMLGNRKKNRLTGRKRRRPPGVSVPHHCEMDLLRILNLRVRGLKKKTCPWIGKGAGKRKKNRRIAPLIMFEFEICRKKICARRTAISREDEVQKEICLSSRTQKKGKTRRIQFSRG